VAEVRETAADRLEGKKRLTRTLEGCLTLLRSPEIEDLKMGMAGLIFLHKREVTSETLASLGALLADVRISPRGPDAPLNVPYLPSKVYTVGELASVAIVDLGGGSVTLIQSLIRSFSESEGEKRVAIAGAIGCFHMNMLKPAIEPVSSMAAPIIEVLAVLMDVRHSRMVDNILSSLQTGLFALAGKLGPQVVPALLPGLEHPLRDLRSSVVRALRETTGQSFGEDSSTWRAWWDSHQSSPGAASGSQTK